MTLPARQNICDWITQCWNIFFGKKVNDSEDGWLLGPTGAIGETAEQFFKRLAEENDLKIQRNAPGSGLIPSFNDWETSISSRVAKFYQRTMDFDFEVTSTWKPVFGSLGYIVIKVFSRRIQQLNLPETTTKNSVTIESEIINLVNEDGMATYTIWYRRIKKTNQVVFYGIYSLCRTPSGTVCVKAIFPLPRGSATVILSVNADPKGNLELISSGNCYGEPGFYFLVKDKHGGLWKHYLRSFRERIFVYEDTECTLKADYSMTLWSLPVFKMSYKLFEK